MNLRQSGLTLLETLVALGILTAALLGILALFISGLKSVQLSERVTVATDIAQDFLELSKRRGFASLSLGLYDGSVPNPPDASTSFPWSPYPNTQVEGIDYTLVVECQEITPGIRQVSVVVSWDSKTEGKVRLQTWIRQ